MFDPTSPLQDVDFVYSYNKVMGQECLRGIANSLNHTNFKILAWYTNPKDTYDCGVRNVRFLLRRPMTSTGKQKFSVYLYYKINADYELEDDKLENKEDKKEEKKVVKKEAKKGKASKGKKTRKGSKKGKSAKRKKTSE